MRRLLRVALAIAALSVPAIPAAHATPDCTPVEAAEAPQVAARDGTPFVVAVRFAPCATAYADVRAWIGNATHQASRVWNGASWASSSGYVDLGALPVAADGRTLFALHARADAANGPALVQTSPQAGLHMRLRAPDGTTGPIALGEITWTDATTSGWFDAVDGWIAARDPAGTLIASAPSGFDKEGTPLPIGYAHIAFGPDHVQGGEPPVAPGDLLVTRFAPALLPDSADLVEIRNPGPEPFPLHGLRIEDGEGTLHVAQIPASPASLAPGQAITLTSTSTDGAADPDATQLLWNDTHLDGPFALAKHGDTIALGYGPLWLDVIAYGSGADAPAGWQGSAVESARVDGRVFIRAEEGHVPVDTDSAADWTRPRVHRQHQTDLPSPVFAAQEARAFVCPDRCHEEALLRIDSATTTLEVNLYDLSHKTIVDAIAAAAQRGVAVRVLLDPKPVGASADKLDRVAWAVDAMRDAGADVRVHNRLRFDYNHAKYLVADNAWTFVVSENANPSGWPSDGASGNRGWGLAVHDPLLALWSSGLFEADFSHPSDSRAVTGRDLQPDAQTPRWAAPDAPADGRRETLVVPGPIRVRPAVAPDHLGDPATNAIVTAIDAARTAVRFQQLNLPLEWSRPGYAETSPIVASLIDAAERGVDVRGVLAGAFEDGDTTTNGNDRTAHVLAALPSPLDVRLGDGPHTDGIVHNKGWIIDDQVVIGSANGNLASQTANREFDLVIVDAQIAAYYAEVLDADHDAAARAGAAPAYPVALPGPSVAVALLVLGGLCRSVLIPRRAGRATS